MDTELIKKVESQYPYPIAATFRRVRTIDPDDIINIHDSFGDLFEIIAKYLAVISLQDFKANYQLPNYFDDFLKKMLHPSLGHWNEVIRMVASEENSKCRIASKVGNFYKTKINADLKKECDTIQNILGSKLSFKTIKDVFDLLILYRNKSKGHGAKISKEEYKDRLKAIENIISLILLELDFVKDFTLFYIDEINVMPTSEFRHKCKVFTGTQVEPKSLVRKKSLLPNHLYLEENGNEDSILIDIYPLLSEYNCKECKSDQIFVFNDYRNGRLEYLSYTCGHFLYPEMLPGEFEKMFKVSLTQIAPDKDLDKNSNDDNKEKAWHLNSMALKKIVNKEYYEALEYFQLSISFHSTWESNYYSALLSMITSGTPTEILFYLNTCEQLEPDNEKTDELKKKFLGVLTSEEDFRMPSAEQIKSIIQIADFILDDEVYIPRVKPIYFYLTPIKFRNNYIVLWLLLPIIYFFISGLISGLIGIEQNYFVQSMKVLMVISFIFIINYITVSLPDLYFSFLQLIPEKSKNGFKKWFGDELDKTFGDFKEEKTIRKSLNFQNKNVKNYLLIFIILYPISILGATYLTCFDDLWTLNTLKVALDYSVMWMVFVLGVPVMINTFKMLRNFSHFPFKTHHRGIKFIVSSKNWKINLQCFYPMDV